MLRYSALVLKVGIDELGINEFQVISVSYCGVTMHGPLPGKLLSH